MPIVLPGESGPLAAHLGRPFQPGDPRVRERYAREVQRIITAAIRGTEQDLVRIREFMRELDLSLRQRLAGVVYQPISLPSIQQSVQQEVEALERALQRLQGEGITAANTAGGSIVTRPLAALTGAQLQGAAVLGLSAELVDIARSHSASLIGFNRGGLAGAILKRINTEITLGVLGSKNNTDVIRGISRAIGQRGVYTYQAERIYQTEALRVFSMSSQASMQEHAQQLGDGLLKGWGRGVSRPEHIDAAERYGEGGKPGPIPVDQPFRVGGELLMFPRDPAGSAANTINCHCFHYPVLLAPEKAIAQRVDLTGKSDAHAVAI